MAAIAQTHDAASGIFGRLLTAIQHMQENRARRAIYNQTLRELNTLTNRDLADLGINRAMIDRLAHEAAWPEDRLDRQHDNTIPTPSSSQGSGPAASSSPSPNKDAVHPVAALFRGT